MSDNTSVPRFDYHKNPINFIRLVDELGAAKVASLIGYSENSVRQMYDKRRGTRICVEFACDNYYKAQKVKQDTDSIFFFAAKPNSPEYAAIISVANALNVNIQKL